MQRTHESCLLLSVKAVEAVADEMQQPLQLCIVRTADDAVPPFV